MKNARSIEYQNETGEKLGAVVWFTGLSGAGKSTLCRELACRLRRRGFRVHVLDGDEMRSELCQDLGFDKASRAENMRRIAYVARLLSEHGVLVLVAAIAPYADSRQQVRDSLPRYIEVFVDAPLAVCEERDPKGWYRRVRNGEVSSFTGVDAPYEKPEHPEVTCSTATESVDACCDKVLVFLGLTQEI